MRLKLGLDLRSLAAACVVVGAACTFDTSGSGGGSPDGGRFDEGPGRDAQNGGSSPDAGGDAAVRIDAIAPGACAANEAELPFDAANLGRCVPRPEDALLVPTGARWRLDTDAILLENLDEVGVSPPIFSASVVSQPQGPEILVAPFTSVRVEEGAQLEVRGSRALAFVSLSDFDIEDGAIVSAAARGVESGAGTSESLCAASGGRGQDGVRQLFDGEEGGSGGGGGGFGAPGGEGAEVHANESDGGPSAGGVAGGDETGRSPLRGGCPGGLGHQVGAENGGAGGGAGGALHLVAAGALDVRGIVTASGGGGRPGHAHGGGGGGGSGGAILLEAGAATLRGALTANGGGGGEGMRRIGTSACNSPTPGEAGAIDSFEPAPGGASGNCSTSGHGGDGGAAAVGAGTDGQEGASTSSGGGGPAPAGGGGGGGGVGRIRIDTCHGATAFDAVLSPAPVVAESLDCR
jgi:hypothetical protein